MQSINSIKPRIPYDNRSDWMAKVHYNYGPKLHLHDIDYIVGGPSTSNDSPEENTNYKVWMEHMSQQGIALAEFKNSHEIIELYKYGQLIWLADGRDIPAYIVVGCQQPYVYYYLIPLNEACKRIINKPEYFSERTYVRFLHYLRKIEPETTALDKLCQTLPPGPERFKPNYA